MWSLGLRFDAMPIEMHLKLPKNNWKDVYGAILTHINICKKEKFLKKAPKAETKLVVSLDSCENNIFVKCEKTPTKVITVMCSPRFGNGFSSPTWKSI